MNIFDQESEIVDEDGTNLLCCNALTWEQLVPASSKGLRKNARCLEKKATTMAPGAFTALQQSLGLTYHKHALLLERQLDAYVDPVEVYMHDQLRVPHPWGGAQRPPPVCAFSTQRSTPQPARSF